MAEINKTLYNNFTMREDEEKCKKAFDSFLKQYYKDEAIIWDDGTDPPDYFLKLDGVEYAVEITSILEKVKLGDRIISHKEIDHSVMEFVESIKEEAIKNGVLKGAYSVFYKPIEKFGKNKHVIATRIWDYLLRTKCDYSSPKECIFGEGHNEWYIQKRHSDRDYLSRNTWVTKWGVELVDELCDTLNETLERKTEKLSAISSPKILLILDRFAWIDAKNWFKYTEKLVNIDKFHTIYLVSDKGGNSVLYSVEKSWLNNKIDNI